LSLVRILGGCWGVRGGEVCGGGLKGSGGRAEFGENRLRQYDIYACIHLLLGGPYVVVPLDYCVVLCCTEPT